MRMLGVFDPLYVRARAALLDAAEAFGAHLKAAVLVGAQAIYLHTGDADLSVAEYTTDADFAISPIELAGTPLLNDLLEGAGFTLREHPGAWLSPGGVYVDLMVPEALAGPGSRGARLGPHGKRAARRAKGLEGALIDRDTRTIGALDPVDTRQVSMWVAGQAPFSLPRSTRSPNVWTRATEYETRTRWMFFPCSGQSTPTSLLTVSGLCSIRTSRAP